MEKRPTENLEAMLEIDPYNPLLGQHVDFCLFWQAIGAGRNHRIAAVNIGAADFNEIAVSRSDSHGFPKGRSVAHDIN